MADASNNTILAVAVAGSITTVQQNTNLPCTPKQIANAALECAKIGIGRWEFPMMTQAWFLGGHVRVGMEDNVYLSKGKLTPSTMALCEKAVRILDDLHTELATPKEARKILGLRTS